MAKLTKVYETADGKLHRDREVAKRHDAWLELVALLRRGAELAESWSEERYGMGLRLCDDAEEAAVGLATYLVAEHADDLRRILRAKPERAE